MLSNPCPDKISRCPIHLTEHCLSVYDILGRRSGTVSEVCESSRADLVIVSRYATEKIGRDGHTAFRYTSMFVLEDFNIDFFDLEPRPRSFEAVYCFLRSPKGGCCSISDDLSGSSKFL